ncbi:hypothetical protein GK047_01215 [Paenibacillus sp. SYP-B3998]|uniref:Uncharacterized protein n=1 Tax=Paenibacillus sp. SYP-B3998 TaxID=2678564 RepID=A0A6G3ZSG0_9BACL|nr:hypothetical protein [Paenibacillus sp. SYP-B3998]NEW04644.1 hypothetical protein [Paenibacillus sp. SYP-B3998]
MKKKIAVTLCLTSMLLISSASLAFASPEQNQNSNQHSKKVLYKADQISNLDSLIERAEKGITDYKSDDSTVESSETTLTSDSGKKGKFKVTKYRTAQLLERALTPDNNIVETFAVTAATESKSNEDWDKTISVRVYSTIYVERTSENGRDYWRLTSATGGFANSDPVVAVTNKVVRMGTTGLHGVTPVQQSQTFNPPFDTFSYTAPSNWTSVDTAKSGSVARDPVVGVTLECKLSGYGSNWTLTPFSNNM